MKLYDVQYKLIAKPQIHTKRVSAHSEDNAKSQIINSNCRINLVGCVEAPLEDQPKS
jgi:hypothetical protein